MARSNDVVGTRKYQVRFVPTLFTIVKSQVYPHFKQDLYLIALRKQWTLSDALPPWLPLFVTLGGSFPIFEKFFHISPHQVILLGSCDALSNIKWFGKIKWVVFFFCPPNS